MPHIRPGIRQTPTDGFYERSRKLAGSRLLQGDENQPAAVQLGPAGSVKGRLLDSDGKPLAGVVLDVHYRDEEAVQIHEVIHAVKLIVSDAKGAFILDELIPEFGLQLTFRRGKQRFEREAKPTDSALQVKPGACRDLGAITLNKVAEKAGE